MADEKLKQELFYMVKLASKYDFSKMEVVEGILRLENERQILSSVFGKRFKTRIFDIAAGQQTDSNCVICGQLAENHVICQHCIDTIGQSEYAKSKSKPEVKKTDKSARKISLPKVSITKISIPKISIPKFSIPKLHIPIFRDKNNSEVNFDKSADVKPKKIKKARLVIQTVLIVCLTLILFLQIGILALWHSMPDYNPREKARNSSYEAVAVNSQDDAYNQLLLDFPESEGYTVSFARMDYDYVGRFLLDKGDCCAEVEEQLTDEQTYDYYFQEEVYVFYISYLEEHTAKLGIAEINQAGSILIEGSFNDGRRTDSFYKFR